MLPLPVGTEEVFASVPSLGLTITGRLTREVL